MKFPLIAALLVAALLTACHRESNAPQSASNASPDNTAAMGASRASAPAAHASPAPVLVPTRVATVATAPNVDTSAGRKIATQGAPGAAACIGCHGANGEGNAQAGFPRLAGLGRIYIEHQMNSFADGTRQSQVMTPIAGALSPQQRAAVAAFYSGLGNTNTAIAAPSETAPVLAVRGDDKRGVQACINCHGAQGIGDAGPNPYLAGQNEAYLAKVMGDWKSGSRHNDPSGQMPAIAKELTDAEAKQLAAYFASLPPPAPRNAQTAAVAFNSQRAAVQSGPAGATAPAQGTGTQQGAALTGGGQSQGAGGAATNPGQTTR